MRMRNRVYVLGAVFSEGKGKRVCELARRRNGARADLKSPQSFRKHTLPHCLSLVRLLSGCAGHQLPSSAPARLWFVTSSSHSPNDADP